MPTFLFNGDSITDCSRLEDGPEGLGDGYVRVIAEELSGIDVVNRGVSGDRVCDLRARWTRDCLDFEPRLVSIMVGINDTWRRYDSGDATSAESFEDDYRALLAPLAGVELVLIEPFLLEVSEEQRSWREDLDPKIGVVRRLASEFGAVLVDADSHLNAVAAEVGTAELTDDGVHLTSAGHLQLASRWLATWRADARSTAVPVES
jgi:lysophospholipase L1-like esterase